MPARSGEPSRERDGAGWRLQALVRALAFLDAPKLPHTPLEQELYRPALIALKLDARAVAALSELSVYVNVLSKRPKSPGPLTATLA